MITRKDLSAQPSCVVPSRQAVNTTRDNIMRGTKLCIACALCAISACALSCGGDEPPLCPWDAEPLQEKALILALERIDCGKLNYSVGQEVLAEALDCFLEARRDGQEVQLSVNYCIDCKIESTFIWTPTDGTLHAHTYISERLYESRVEKCSDVAFQAIPSDVVEYLTCLDPEPVFACEGQSSDVR
jgi:hypothetical protein